MGTPVPISLGTKSNPSRHSKQAGNARLINCFSEPLGDEGKNQWVITADLGLETFGAALSGASGGVRAMLEVDGYLWVVAGRQLYKVDTTGTSTLIGGIPTDGPVYMRRNVAVPSQICIVSDGYVAVVSSDVLTVVTDTDLPPPICLAYLDGYGVYPISRARFMLSQINDFTSVDGLDEGSVGAVPGEIVGAHELGREVVFFKTKSMEWHQDTGDADFPFQRSQAAEIGCLSAGSVAPVSGASGQTLMWVAHDHSVRIMQGYGGQAVSTPKLEALIKDLDEAGRAAELTATSWSWAGRSFYVISCADWSWQFDVKTGNWHERKSYGSDRWMVSKIVSFAGMLIAGDASTGQLYEMRDDIYAENGAALTFEVITPPVHGHPFRFIHNALFIDAVVGVGLNSTDTYKANPTLLVDWSHDGGASWSSPREVALGAQGRTATRTTPLYRLGKVGAQGRVYRFRISDPVQKVLMSASLDAEKLAA